MEEKLDKLFKDKLGTFRAEPTENAWAQIHQQLSSSKRKVLTIRFAAAASIAILISLGVLSYLFVDQINPTDDRLSDAKQEQLQEGSKVGTTPLKNEENVNAVLEPQDDEKAMIAQKLNQQPAMESPEKRNADVESASLSEAKPAKQGTLPVMKPAEVLTARETQVNKEEDDGLPSRKEDTELVAQVLLEEKELEPAKTAEEIPEQKPTKNGKKTYPQVKIIYKASSESELVASNKNLIDKGIKKITKFSDERILTDEVKTKLRNTKDDLLALNFGKLLNKSNRDIDN